MDSSTDDPKGLGGWLILPIIGLFANLVRLGALMINDMLPIFQKHYWEVLTTPGSPAYHHLWAPLLIFEIVGNSLFLLLSAVLIVLCFRKSYRFPKMFIGFMLFNLVFVVSDFFLADMIPAVKAQGDTESLQEIARVLIGSLIWVPYFIVSKRVRNTFIKPAYGLQP